jgi:hypothetical protein
VHNLTDTRLANWIALLEYSIYNSSQPEGLLPPTAHKVLNALDAGMGKVESDAQAKMVVECMMRLASAGNSQSVTSRTFSMGDYLTRYFRLCLSALGRCSQFLRREAKDPALRSSIEEHISTTRMLKESPPV